VRHAKRGKAGPPKLASSLVFGAIRDRCLPPQWRIRTSLGGKLQMNVMNRLVLVFLGKLGMCCEPRLSDR